MAEPRDKKFSEYNQNGDPERAHAHIGQVDESCAHEYLVRQWVDELTEVGDKVVLTGNVAIKKITDGTCYKCPQRHAGTDGNRYEPPLLRHGVHGTDAVDERRYSIYGQSYGEDDNKENACQCDAVRQVKHIRAYFTSFGAYLQDKIGYMSALEHKNRASGALLRLILTYSLLACMRECAILCAMNGFRITLLALLILVVGLMFYVIFVTLPGMQADHNIYEITQKNSLVAQENEGHRDRVSAYGDGAEKQELASAYSAAAEEEKLAEKSVYEAEERAVIEEARRKAAAALAQEVKAADEAPDAIGLVTSFNRDWVSIMFRPAVKDPINEGLVVAVRRDGVVLCEATVDYKDEESGQIGATMKPQEFGKSQVNIDQEKMLPMPGDEVIYSPFVSTRDLKAVNSFLQPAPISVPADGGAAPAADTQESALTPIPQP